MSLRQDTGKLSVTAVGQLSHSVQPQLAWLRAASLCLISWFSSSILEMVLRTESFAYSEQGTCSKKKRKKKADGLSHGYRGNNIMCVCMVDEEEQIQQFYQRAFFLACYSRKSINVTGNINDDLSFSRFNKAHIV